MTERPPEGEATDAASSFSVVRSELGRFLELSSLVGFAVVAPVLGAFGESTETFVAVSARPGDIVRFGLLITFGPLVVLGLLATATRVLGEPARRLVQHGLVGLLGGIVATTLARQAGAATVLRVLAAVAVGSAAVWLHRSWHPGKLFLRYASPAPVFFLLIFTLGSPVASLVNPQEVEVASRSAGDEPPVVVIVLDELPTESIVGADGSIDAELFPNLARLASRSTWYRDNTTVGSRTNVALPSIATGQLPGRGDEIPPVLSNFPDNLLTLMAETHQVHATEWITQFCPTSVCDQTKPPLDDDARALLRQAVPDRSEPVSQLLKEARSLWWEQAWPGADDQPSTYTVAGATEPDEAARPALEFLSSLKEVDGDRPTFDYVHVPLPHQPWRLLPSGDTYDAPHPARGTEFIGWQDNELGGELGAAARVRHRLQLQWTDRWLGSVLDRLESLDRYDDALVVLTADHGVSFSRGQPLRGLVPGNEHEIAWTPLLVKLPGQAKPATDDRNTMTIDIVPTVADVVGVDVPWKLDGQSLLGPPRTDDKKPTESGDAELFTTRLEGNRVLLDDGGLAAIDAAAAAAGEPGDPLRIWREGRHGDLIGEQVKDLDECPSPTPSPPKVSYQPPADWDAFAAGNLAPGTPLPIWQNAYVDSEDSPDLAAVVDGVVVAWSAVRRADSRNDAGFFLTLPLLDAPMGTPEIYAIDGPRCLRPVV